MKPLPLHVIKGVEIWQDDANAETPWRVHYVAGLAVDVDGALAAYRLDNDQRRALDDIHLSAGYPHGSWQNILVADPDDPSRPYVDEDGFCVSMTSYAREEFDVFDRRRWLDAVAIDYAVVPSIVRQQARGVILGCASRVTNLLTGFFVDTVTGDLSGYSVGEASLKTARRFNPLLSARNGDDRRIFRFEFFPDRPAVVNGETFQLKPIRHK